MWQGNKFKNVQWDIHSSFDKYFLGRNYVPVTALGTGDNGVGCDREKKKKRDTT